MKSEQLLKAMSQIDDKYVTAAAKKDETPAVKKKEIKRPRIRPVRWLAAAVVITVLLSVVVVASSEEIRMAVARAYRRFIYSGPSETVFDTSENGGDDPAELPISVVPATEYEREACDVMTGETLQLTHSVSIPEIDRESPGAAALNEKIFNTFYGFIDVLERGEEGGNIFKVSYLSGEEYGMIQIYVSVDTIVQYSEAFHENYVFYYDKSADREITYAEFAAAAGIDGEKVMAAVLNSTEHKNRAAFAFGGCDVGIEGVFLSGEQEEYCRVLVSYTTPEGLVSPVATENVFDRETYESLRTSTADE